MNSKNITFEKIRFANDYIALNNLSRTFYFFGVKIYETDAPFELIQYLDMIKDKFIETHPDETKNVIYCFNPICKGACDLFNLWSESADETLLGCCMDVTIHFAINNCPVNIGIEIRFLECFLSSGIPCGNIKFRCPRKDGCLHYDSDGKIRFNKLKFEEEYGFNSSLK